MKVKGEGGNFLLLQIIALKNSQVKFHRLMKIVEFFLRFSLSKKKTLATILCEEYSKISEVRNFENKMMENKSAISKKSSTNHFHATSQIRTSLR